jgi:hypothetical protein
MASGASRLWRAIFGEAAESGPALRAGDEIAETSTQRVVKESTEVVTEKAAREAAEKLATPLDALISEGDLAKAARDAAYRSRASMGTRAFNQGKLPSSLPDAQRGIKEYIQDVADEKYRDALKVAQGKVDAVEGKLLGITDESGLRLAERDFARAQRELAALEKSKADEIQAFMKSNDAAISRITKDVAVKADKGNYFVNVAKNNPGRTAVGTALVGGYGYSKLSGAFSDSAEGGAGSGISDLTSGNPLADVMNLGLNGLGDFFNYATGLIEHTGINPTAADWIVGGAGLMASYAMLKQIPKALGIDSSIINAGIGLLCLAAVVTIARAGNKLEINDEREVATAPTGPGMAPA